ncbi:hypothetical protein CASFOL_003769 [Castilleja foliolosa]|uniref:Uncharacterized protein n=1 Tax=Castilleja foliolosa TaxID=1961234 RepID=A0ABD3EI49_9LAMI
MNNVIQIASFSIGPPNPPDPHCFKLALIVYGGRLTLHGLFPLKKGNKNFPPAKNLGALTLESFKLEVETLSPVDQNNLSYIWPTTDETKEDITLWFFQCNKHHGNFSVTIFLNVILDLFRELSQTGIGEPMKALYLGLEPSKLLPSSGGLYAKGIVEGVANYFWSTFNVNV